MSRKPPSYGQRSALTDAFARARSVLAVAVLAAGTPAVFAAPPVVTCNPADTNIFNTAYNGANGILADGAQDSQWQVSDMQPKVVGTSSPPPAGLTWNPAHVGNLASFAWNGSPYGTANWISREAGPSGDGDWYYRYEFILDPAVNPAAFRLNMNFMADNSVAEVFVNGALQSGLSGVPQAGNLDGYQFQGYLWANRSQALLTQNWVTGLNTVVVRVQSDHDYEGFLAAIEPGPVCGTAPRVSVAKTAPATLAAGSPITYTVTATNTGSVPADGTVVTDTLSTSLTSPTWTCTASGGAVCPNPTAPGSLAETIATFPAGSSVVYTINATVPATAPAGTLTNTAVLTPPAGGVCDGPGGACNATATTAISAVAAVPTLGQWALLLLSVLVGLSLLVQHRRGPR